MSLLISIHYIETQYHGRHWIRILVAREEEDISISHPSFGFTEAMALLSINCVSVWSTDFFCNIHSSTPLGGESSLKSEYRYTNIPPPPLELQKPSKSNKLSRCGSARIQGTYCLNMKKPKEYGGSIPSTWDFLANIAKINDQSMWIKLLITISKIVLIT